VVGYGWDGVRGSSLPSPGEPGGAHGAELQVLLGWARGWVGTVPTSNPPQNLHECF
jgi:hypothetical protein